MWDGGLILRHEQTVAYQRCVELMEIACEVIDEFPKGFGFLADPLRRNTSSTALNFAEGYYQRPRGQQRKFLDYSEQSAREASAAFDAARAFRLAQPDKIARGKQLALEIVKLISGFQRRS